MSEKDRCEIKFVPKGKSDWELELSGKCGATIQQIEALPGRKRRYVQRRIRVID